MKTNFDPCGRRKPRGLYLIELRQRLAQEKALRAQVVVAPVEPRPRPSRGSCLSPLAPAPPESVSAG